MTSQSGPTSATAFLSLLLNSELVRWVAIELLQVWRSTRWRGTYKVSEYRAMLVLSDKHGKTALATKHQKVEYLQDGVFAIQDQAWGDGEIFDDYRCSPGIAVDRHVESYRWKILISLRTTKNKGDKDVFFIERRIKNGFTTSVEHFQTQIDHPTTNLTLAVNFPKDRIPKSVVGMEQNAKRSTTLTEAHRTTLLEGRIQYEWCIAKPRLYEAYIMRWEW